MYRPDLTNQRNVLHDLPCLVFQARFCIDFVVSQVDLGVTLYNEFLWIKNCDELVSKANSKLGQFMRTCHFTRYRGQKTKNNFLFNNSKIEFLTLLYYIWHPQSSNQLAKFAAIQRRATIWIYGLKFDHYKYNEYFDKLK